MIEFIIMIFVIGWFAKTANKNGQSGVLWGLVGAASYYVPVLIFGFYIYPDMVRGSRLSHGESFKAGIFFSLVIGIICCLLSRHMLLNSIKNTQNSNEEGITSEAFKELSSEDQKGAILQIFKKLSAERKDLSEIGIIYKIEEDYGYKEELIKSVVEKVKI